MTAPPAADPRAALSEDARAKQRAYRKHLDGCFWCADLGLPCREGDRLYDDAHAAYGRLERRVGR